MKQYRDVLNRQGFQSLHTPVQFPDYHLMVGDAEDLTSQPTIIWQAYIPKEQAVMLPDVDEMSYEEIQQNLASGKLTINDFFQNIYPLGEPLV